MDFIEVEEVDLVIGVNAAGETNLGR